MNVVRFLAELRQNGSEMPAASAPDQPDARVRIIPLGGLGEIGMNCLAVEQGDDITLVVVRMK